MRLGLGWGRGGGHRGQRWVQGEAKLKVKEGTGLQKEEGLGAAKDSGAGSGRAGGGCGACFWQLAIWQVGKHCSGWRQSCGGGAELPF